MTTIPNISTMYTTKASAYARGRHEYSSELVGLLSKIGVKKSVVVADVGAGTGIFSGQLLSLGATVLAIEPNKDMRAASLSKLGDNPDFYSVPGNASNTGLADGSVDLVTAAQSFHWFDPIGFKNECNRIMKPGGLVVLVWDRRCLSMDFARDEYMLFKHANPGYTKPDLDRTIYENSYLFFDKFGIHNFEKNIEYDYLSFINYYKSLSHAPKISDTKYFQFLEGVRELFDKHSDGKSICMPSQTTAYIGRPGR